MGGEDGGLAELSLGQKGLLELSNLSSNASWDWGQGRRAEGCWG